MNSLDWIVIIIIGISVFLGYHKGLIKTLFDFISMILAFIMTYLLYPYVSLFLIKHTKIHEKIASKIQEVFELDKLLLGAVSKESQMDSIGMMGIPKGLKESLIQNNNEEIFRLLGVDSFEEYVSHYIATVTMNILVLVILFIAITIVLALLVRVLDLIAKLPVLKQANKSAGAVIGLFMGILTVSVVILVISSLISLQGDQKLLELIETGSISKWFYDNNPLEHLTEIKSFITTKLPKVPKA
ncbi:MAG: CvpA family protein [Vallitaleaceae bacterium]|nr:CvpA family protein [Vallitaleaceae bacterium]